MLYKQILQKRAEGKRQAAVLVDPGKQGNGYLQRTIDTANQCGIDYFLVGGSLVSETIDRTITRLKQESNIPVLLFPGSLLQLSDAADAVLLLSLISGRNPEFLIGNHVIAAPLLKKSNLEIIPTGYMLIDSGKTTSVQYISNTQPIPADKTDIATATALAGEMLGLKLIYLEAGSGAQFPVPARMIAEVRSAISIPIIVGGGLRSREHIEQAFDAGADLVVLGTIVESNPGLLPSLLASS